MVRITDDFRLIVEVVCMFILYGLVAIPLAVAAFTVSVYMGVPFVIVLGLGWVKRLMHNT